ncbi:ribosome-binding protein [Tritrichomonas musculus]|uniref:60S ribosomal export protein NMD3 n=1 Tax=Tritrichomonas musculus TaxID=1915356 RepID=A0ABR2HJV2_9EUKA
MEEKNFISSFPPKQINIKRCQICKRYQLGNDSASNFVPIIFESDDFIQFCLSFLLCPQNIQITRANIIQSNYSSSNSFLLSIDFINDGNQKKQAAIHFIIEDSMCNFCKESLISVQSQQWSSTVIISAFDDRTRPLQWLEKEIEKSFQIKNSPNDLNNSMNPASMMTKENDTLIYKFNSKITAFRLVSFIKSEIAVQIKEIIEKVPRNASFNSESFYDHDLNVTYSVSLPGIWEDDLVCLPESICQIKGSSCLCICTKVSDSIIFTDPESGILTEITPEEYWKNPFSALIKKSSMVLFDVITITTFGPKCGRNQMCDLEIVLDVNNLTEKSVIFDKNKNANDKSNVNLNFISIFVKSHLGDQLQPGDFCLGYDLRNGIDIPPGSGPLHSQPEAVIVSKVDSIENFNHEYFVNEFVKDGFNIGMIKEYLLVNKVPPPEQSNQSGEQKELSNQFNSLVV